MAAAVTGGIANQQDRTAGPFFRSCRTGSPNSAISSAVGIPIADHVCDAEGNSNHQKIYSRVLVVCHTSVHSLSEPYICIAMAPASTMPCYGCVTPRALLCLTPPFRTSALSNILRPHFAHQLLAMSPITFRASVRDCNVQHQL